MPEFPVPISNGGVGGRIQKHYLNWTLITEDQFCLDVVQNGYKPQFKVKPPLVKNPEPFEYNLSSEQKVALDHEINHFLEHDVIERVENINSPGFYSCLFVRPRSNDSPNRWRCIFDISRLNKFMKAPKFTMESPNTIRKLFKLDHYCVKLDLSDAFLHVPLHPAYRRYMRFFHRGVAYQFKTICFGANFSPFIFSYLINITLRFFHSMCIELAAYLDDCYAQHPVPDTLSLQINYVIQVMSHLGWTINFDKSITEPCQIMDYIGLHTDLQLGLVYPPMDRWNKIQALCQYFMTLSSTTAKLWSSLLGLLTSCQDLTYMGRLWLRPLQNHVNSQWKDRTNLHTQITVTNQCKQAIAWWMDYHNVMDGVPWTFPPPELTIFTDSSQEGWGGGT